MAIQVPTIRLAPGRSPQTGGYAFTPGQRVSGPLISCLMVTRGGKFPAMFAIECYRRQTWQNRELVIVCDKPDAPIKTLVAELADPSIRYVDAHSASLGELRNTSVAHARGDLLCQWDDDDLYHPQRIEFMAGALIEHGVSAVFLQRWLIWWPARRQLAVSGSRTWEGSMIVDRAILPTYPAQALAEDNITIARLCSLHPTLLIDRAALYCYIVHGANSYEDRHFETMVKWASTVIPDERYDGELQALASSFPLSDYAAYLGGAALA
ncbi:hypothetical protein BH09PSE3_BH09PSE3_22920 [soil metagenome]